MKIFILICLISTSAQAKKISLGDLSPGTEIGEVKKQPRIEYEGSPEIALGNNPLEVPGTKAPSQGYRPPIRPQYMNIQNTSRGDFQAYKTLHSVGRN